MKVRYFLLVVLLLLGTVYAVQQITTPVRFILPTTTTFTLAIPGTNATTFSTTDSPGTTTATTIIFNSTSTTIGGVNASAVGGGGTQGPTTPIFNFTNTGNIKINITANFSTALPSGIVVKAGWGTNAYQASCVAASKGPPGGGTGLLTQCVNITDSETPATLANLSTSGVAAHRDVWVWADYSSATAGIDNSVNMVIQSGNFSG